ncbi:MAG: ribbon-helix-helix protein, CopG family [Lysobacteraceae bacterium]|nr:MAG: ribbon-helix-helix protein, CopG family [Xanthomonadaceae bacterium]
MSGEIVDNVRGLSQERLDELVAEAEAGYDLDALTPVPNPHASVQTLVPAELLEEIAARAAREGRSPADVVREAITAYLRSA